MKQKNLKTLFWPIFFEIVFLMLAGMVDTLMLSGLNYKAVGAVGTSNTYLSIFVIMFSIISTGMVSVMTQYIGAGKEYVAKQAKNIGLLLNGIIGISLSLLLGFCAKEILTIVGVASSLLDYATTYMVIVGGASIITAFIPIYNNYLRSFGYTKITMIATISSNILNLILNALFLYILKMGVAGIATATVISKIVNLLIITIYAERNITFTNHPLDISNKLILKQIIKIGIPAAAESALYNVASTLIIKFLNEMDADGINVTAQTYVFTITNFSYCAALALAQANSILLGWSIGKHQYEKGYKNTFKALKYGILISLSVSILFVIFSKPILSLFTDNTAIISLATKLLIIDIFLEFGRVANLVFATALKTAGDALYIVIIASIVMLLVGSGGTYILGLKLELLAVGAYISMALDEIIRGIVSLFRFVSRKWESKTLV